MFHFFLVLLSVLMFYLHFLLPLFFLFLGLLDLLHLAGFVHHFAVDHRLRHHLHNLPGANIRLLCTETEMRLNEMG